jgi:tRNA1Val (adenine37-N6)-methyltransferase
VCQPKIGFRFSTDSIVLAQFIKERKYKRAIDVGSGSGVLALYISRVLKCPYVDAIEIQSELYKCLVKTVEINDLYNIMHPHYGDVNLFRPVLQYDLIVCNPPYRENNRGKVSENKIKKDARFSNSLTIDNIFTFALKYLKNAGFLYLSYDVDLMVDLIAMSRTYRLELKRMMFLHHEVSRRAKLAFMEFKKNAGKELIVEPPFIQKKPM